MASRHLTVESSAIEAVRYPADRKHAIRNKHKQPTPA
jgi:hypothetical protein